MADLEKGRELLRARRLSVEESRLLGKPPLELKEPLRVAELLKRPAARLDDFRSFIPELNTLNPRAADSLEIEIKFEGYLRRQEEEVSRLTREEELPIPADLDFMSLSGLSTEVKEVLHKNRPATLGQAGRLTGMTPAALTVLAIQLKAADKLFISK